MDKNSLIALSVSVSFFLGIFLGYLWGLTNGVALGARFQSGRPASPLWWILCFVLAGVFLLVSIGTSIYSIYFIANSLPAQATVIRIDETKDDDGNIFHKPVYTYTTKTGETFTDRTSMSDGREYQIGDIIPIRYLSSSPQESRINYFFHIWFIPIFFGGFFVAMAGVGAGLRWWQNKEQQWAYKRMQSLVSPSPTPEKEAEK